MCPSASHSTFTAKPSQVYMPKVLGKDKIPSHASTQTSDPVKVCQHKVVSNQVLKSISPDPYEQILRSQGGLGGEFLIPHPPEALALFLDLSLQDVSDSALECPLPATPGLRNLRVCASLHPSLSQWSHHRFPTKEFYPPCRSRVGGPVVSLPAIS